MKKLFLLLILTLLVGCSNSETNNNDSNFNSDQNSDTREEAEVESSSINSLPYKYDSSTVGQNPVTLYLFYSSSCPHCHEEIEWLDTLATTYPYLKIEKHEASIDMDFYELVKDKMKIDSPYVPLTIIGNDYRIGYSSASNDELINLFEYYSTFASCDVVDTIKNNGDVTACQTRNQKK